MLLRGIIFLVLVVVLVLVAMSWLRRAPRRADENEDEADVASEPAPAAPAALPAPIEDTSRALGREVVLRALHELALGETLQAAVPAAHAKVVASIGPTLEINATDPRYAPRRPLMLPELLRAAGDDETSRKDLADIIGRDPSLVGSLLKLANSSYYRTSSKPIESIDRAVTILGHQGIRSLAAAALVQPVFRAGSKDFRQFAEVAWEHAYRSAAAAEVYAFAIEGEDPFAAQLIALVSGLASIVVFRIGLDHYTAQGLRPDATAIAALLDEHTPEVARRIAATWELSSRLLEALDDQLRGRPSRPATGLGRSLRFGLVAGALSVLAANELIDEETARVSLVAHGGAGKKFERMWERLAAPASAS
jgi:HD-like signal output (HDOD) protein